MDSPDLEALEIEAELRRRRRARLAHQHKPETWTEAEREARQREVEDAIREIRRGGADSGPGRVFADDPMAHGSSYEGGGVDSWLRNL